MKTPRTRRQRGPKEEQDGVDQKRVEKEEIKKVE